MEELIKWITDNKISHTVVGDDVIEIDGFGKMLFQDMEKLSSILRVKEGGECVFNCIETPQALAEEGIGFVTFKFGDNFYYTPVDGDFKLNILKYVGNKTPMEHQFYFANLGIHTPYELLNGSFDISQWIKKAKFCGHEAIGICDTNTMAACYQLQKKAKAAGISYVFGYSLTFTKDEDRVGAKVYVQTQEGLANLLRIQKAIMVDSETQTIEFDELLRRGKGNVLVLDKWSSDWLMSHCCDDLDAMQHSFERVFYQVDLSEFKAERHDIKLLEATKKYFDHLMGNVEPILISDAYYLDKDDAKNKVILNKVALGAAHMQSDDQFFKDTDEHYAYFEEMFGSNWDSYKLFDQCCKNTLYIVENAKAEFEDTRNFMPKYDMTEYERLTYGTVHEMFSGLLEEGLQKLIPAHDQEKYRKQMEYEKYIIESTNNVDYLLVQYDTCKWARENNILVGCGRGSAAGSLLLYLLGITLIDPLKYDLIFERFLLPERAGLYEGETTIFAKDIESQEYIKVEIDGKTINLDKDAEVIVYREGVDKPIRIYADEIVVGDDKIGRAHV